MTLALLALLFELLAASFRAFVYINVCSLMCVCVCSVYSIQGQSVQMVSPSSESHQQVVAVGQPLTAQPQGTVVVKHVYVSYSATTWFSMRTKTFLCLRQLTAKNIQCMRTLLNLAHCHGAYLGTSWQLVLATLQVQV